MVYEHRISIGVLNQKIRDPLTLLTLYFPTCPENIIRDRIEIVPLTLWRVNQSGREWAETAKDAQQWYCG